MATPLTARTVPVVSTQVFGRRAETIPWNGHEESKENSQRQELQGYGQSLGEEGHHMDPGADGNSKVAADEGGEPFEILDHDGLIEAQLLAYGLDHLIAGPFAPTTAREGSPGSTMQRVKEMRETTKRVIRVCRSLRMMKAFTVKPFWSAAWGRG